MAILANVKIDAGVNMDVYIRIISLDSITNHAGGGSAMVIVRGYLKELVDGDEYTDFKGSNPPPFCWGGDSGRLYEVDIDPSNSSKSVYQQAYESLLSNEDFTSILVNPLPA